MPCFSRIVTKLTDGARIERALSDLGYKVTVSNGVIYGEHESENSVSFVRSGNTYTTTRYANIAPIAKRYAEIGVREFAQRKGFAVIESDGTQLTLVSRRG